MDVRDTIVSDLFLLHHRRLVGLASLLVDDRQAAEEVVQDAFANLYRSWKKLRDPDAAVAFLNRTVVNAGRDSLRRGNARRGPSGSWCRARRPSSRPSTPPWQHQESDRLWAAVTAPARASAPGAGAALLPRPERGRDRRDVLQISRGSVKKHASRGIAALALEWGER